jgi:hypothetical protein
MALISRSLHRAFALTIGIIMMVTGLAMTASIVFLPAGIVIGLLGVMICIYGFSAP